MSRQKEAVLERCFQLSYDHNKVDIEKLFYGLQNQMRANLTTIRENISHPSALGDASELNWIELFRKYLPTRYSVDKGQVLDSQGHQSEQIDVVIYDRHYSPFFFNEGSIRYFPAESVYAVFETKQELSKSHIRYAGKKTASVRNLHRTSNVIIERGEPHEARELHYILGGILTLQSAWNPPLSTPFRASITSRSSNQRLDLGCALNSGSFRVDYSSTPKIEISTSKNSLIFFFLTLLSKLQKIGTAPAMDISAYENTIDDYLFEN